MERTLSRRKILGAASAFAGGSALAGAALAASTAGAATDPVMVLAAQRCALYASAQPFADAYAKLMPGDPRETELWDQQAVYWDQSNVIEQEMMGLVATSAAGIAEQLGLLRDFVSVSEYEPLIDN